MGIWAQKMQTEATDELYRLRLSSRLVHRRAEGGLQTETVAANLDDEVNELPEAAFDGIEGELPTQDERDDIGKSGEDLRFHRQLQTLLTCRRPCPVSVFANEPWLLA